MTSWYSTKIVMQGELKKRGIFNRWRKYFFIVREDGIMYNYASQVRRFIDIDVIGYLTRTKRYHLLVIAALRVQF